MSDFSLWPVLARMLDQDRRDRARIYAFHLGQFVRCTTPRKLANLIMTKSQRWLRRERVAGMPAKFFIDPINVCNLRCPLCATGRGVLARPRGLVALADLKRVVDEIAPYAYQIELYNWGEPLLHPDIFEMIQYASQRRITVGLSSNLNRLDADMARRLVESGLTQLVVSIDGAIQESYAAYRRGGQLDKVLENLELLLETRRSLERRTPFVMWRMLVGKHNEHEIEAVGRMAHEMGVDSFSTSVLYVDTEDKDQVAQWLPTDPAYSPYDHKGEKLENTWHCHDLWESMVINWDGGVAPCCWLHDSQFDFGNVSDQTVREIWNNQSYVSARRVIGKKRMRPGEVPTICHRCRGHPSYLAY
jgi:radical SAM protein with 4Fe4S-binding SPASM domain